MERSLYLKWASALVPRGEIVEETSRKDGGRRKWYDKYLPFVARSPEMQIEWLSRNLDRIREKSLSGKDGLSKEEITPYIKLFLEANSSAEEALAEGGEEFAPLQEMFKKIPVELLPLLMECTDIYDVPKLIRMICKPSRELAMAALKKVPPPYEKSPLLVIDRVFHSINECGGDLLERSAESVLASSDIPDGFAKNYKRFQEIMMDEEILSILYPKAR